MPDAPKRPRGRPKGTAPHAVYTARMCFALTPAQLDAVREAAKAVGEHASDYVRESLAREMGERWPR